MQFIPENHSALQNNSAFSFLNRNLHFGVGFFMAKTIQASREGSLIVRSKVKGAEKIPSIRKELLHSEKTLKYFSQLHCDAKLQSRFARVKDFLTYCMKGAFFVMKGPF